MEMVGDNPNPQWLPIAKKLRRPIPECTAMHRMLTEYDRLGKPTIVVENGIRTHVSLNFPLKRTS